MIIQGLLEKAYILFSNQNRYQKYLRKKGVSIGEDCQIYKNVKFGTEPYLISIGNHVRLTDNVRFITHDGAVWVLRKLYNDNSLDIVKPITIKDNVFVGWGGVILPGVTIGENSIIATGAVVTKDVPANEIWGGVPAHFIKRVSDYYCDNKEGMLFTHEMSQNEKREYLIQHFKNSRKEKNEK